MMKLYVKCNKCGKPTGTKKTTDRVICKKCKKELK